MQRYSAVGGNNRCAKGRLCVHFVDVRGHVVQAFRPQEKAVLCESTPGQCQMSVQFGMGRVGGEVEILGAAFGVEPIGDGDRFQQGGFPGSIFAYENGDRMIQLYAVPGKVFHRGKLCQIGIGVNRFLEPQTADVLRIHG